MFKYIFLFLITILTISCKNTNQTSTKETANEIATDTATLNPKSENKKTIIFFGNSLTAGYGLEEEQSFPSLIQKRIDSLKLPYSVVNAGLSGETSADGKSRINWILKQHVDIFVLELGANDVLRGQQLKQTEENLRAILNSVISKYPDAKIVLAGMQAPANMGKDYTKTFATIYPKLSKDYNAKLIPFLLENVAMIPSLNLQDGKHPNAEGQKIVVENVWAVLKNVL